MLCWRHRGAGGDGMGLVCCNGDILRRCKLGASFETGGGRTWFRVVVVVVLWVMLGLLATDGGQEWVVRLWLVRCVSVVGLAELTGDLQRRRRDAGVQGVRCVDSGFGGRGDGRRRCLLSCERHRQEGSGKGEASATTFLRAGANRRRKGLVREIRNRLSCVLGIIFWAQHSAGDWGERESQKSFSISPNKIRRLTIFFSAEARPTVFLRLCQRRLRLQSCCEARRRQVPAEGCCGDGGIRRGVGSHCRGCGERSGVSTVAICK